MTDVADVEPAEALVDEKEDSDEVGEGARSLRKAAVKSRSSRRLWSLTRSSGPRRSRSGSARFRTSSTSSIRCIASSINLRSSSLASGMIILRSSSRPRSS